MKRRVPRLASDEEAEAFLESDLSELDFSQFKSGRLRFKDRSTSAIEVQPSEAYRLFEQAMIEEKQIVFMCGGVPREVCPILLGHTEGVERALTYQFAGKSTSRPLPPGGDWRCFDLANVTELQLREGPWISGASHTQRSQCVTDVDLDVNPESPYKPKRSLEQLRAGRTGPAASVHRGSMTKAGGGRRFSKPGC